MLWHPNAAPSPPSSACQHELHHCRCACELQARDAEEGQCQLFKQAKPFYATAYVQHKDSRKCLDAVAAWERSAVGKAHLQRAAARFGTLPVTMQQQRILVDELGASPSWRASAARCTQRA
jgi:hypothetical protein